MSKRLVIEAALREHRCERESESEDQVTHTPGPWKLKVDQYGAHAIKGPDGRSVATVIQRRAEVRANAYIIEAAPDSYRALLAMLLLAGNQLSPEGRLKALKMAEDAVAKAEGR